MERSLRFLREHVGGLLFRWVSEFYFTRDENMIDMIDQTSKTNLTGIAAKKHDKIPW